MSKNYELMRQIGDTHLLSGREIASNPHPVLPVAMRSPHGPAVRKTSDDSDFDMYAVLQILRRRRVWIYGSTAAMLIAAALVCILMTPKYKAESKLEILKGDTAGLSLGNTSASAASSDALDFNLTLQTQLAVLKSNALAWQVIKELGVDGAGTSASETSMKTPATGLPSAGSEATSDKRAAEILWNFKSNLAVDSISGTRLIKVSYLDRDPKMAARIVNQLVSEFIEYNFQVRYRATTKATDWLGQQLVDLKRQVENSQARAVQLEKESGIFGEDEHHNIVLTRLEQLNNEVTTAEADRVVKEAVYNLSRSGNPELVASLVGAPAGSGAPDIASTVTVLNALRQQEATLNAEYADASAKYGPAYPRLIQMNQRVSSIRSSIAAELRKVVARAKNEYELAASREIAAKKAFAEQKIVAAQMNDKATNYLIAKHEAESGRVLYEHLLEKVKEAGVLAGLRSSDLHVVDPARVPVHPARPNVPLYLGLGALAGMILGVVCVFVVETIDDTVRDVGEVETNTYVPVLGIIPHTGLLPAMGFKYWLGTYRSSARNGTSHDALLLSLRDPAVAEAFRSVRTSLLLSRPNEPIKVLMVTSALSQEGKSFASLNLAAALARNKGKVLLVDADLRRGSLSRLLNQRSEMGLSQVLLRETGADAAYRQIDNVPGLTFMPAGAWRHGPSELLESQQMSAIIHTWRQQFAYVVIDTPPVLPVTDPVVLSPKVDVVIVVVRFGVTNRQSIFRAVRLFRDVQAARIGVLVNGMDVHSPEYYHYAGSTGYDQYHRGNFGGGQLISPASQTGT